MQISGISSGSFPLQAPAALMSRGEEAGEAASGPAEEAAESGASLKLAAERDRGMGTTIDLMA
jgi:hypothetical protein